MTNTFLCKMGIIPSPACSLCGESDESLEHLFLSCHYTKNFWSEVIKWLVDHKVKIENLSDKDILFGIIGCEDEIFVNHILLLAKQYLYSCIQIKYSLSNRVLNSKINTVFLIETLIAKFAGESLERGRRHLGRKNKLRLTRLRWVLAWRERIKFKFHDVFYKNSWSLAWLIAHWSFIERKICAAGYDSSFSKIPRISSRETCVYDRSSGYQPSVARLFLFPLFSL